MSARSSSCPIKPGLYHTRDTPVHEHGLSRETHGAVGSTSSSEMLSGLPHVPRGLTDVTLLGTRGLFQSP